MRTSRGWTGWTSLGRALACLLGLGGVEAAPSTVPAWSSMSAVLQARYDAWAPIQADTTPLALLRLQGLDWLTATGQLKALYDDSHAFAELRGVSVLPDGRQSVGVLRAALYRQAEAAGVLVLNDEWCAAGLCKARTRFLQLRSGQPDMPVPESRLVPRILDRDLIDGPVPDCLKGVVLGVQYLPSRYDASLTALATVTPSERAACEKAGTEVGLVTRALRLSWKAGAGKFARSW